MNTLNCFTNFKCINKNCKNSCCERWKIFIDKKTLKKYKKYKGDFSATLKENVDFKNAQLKMQDGRCAFLNQDNLCDLIINLGEEYLCDICRLHPRYVSFLSKYVEGGIGLSCEEGARLLLNFTDKIAPIIPVDKSRLKPFEKKIVEFRQDVLEILYDSRLTFSNRINAILDYLNVPSEKFFSLKLSRLIEKLEKLDDNWLGFKRLSFNPISPSENFTQPLINLTAYFIYRHLINAVDLLDLRSRTLFAIFSVFAIYNICITQKEQLNLNLLTDIARSYSAEIEYSLDNLFAVLDFLEPLCL